MENSVSDRVWLTGRAGCEAPNEDVPALVRRTFASFVDSELHELSRRLLGEVAPRQRLDTTTLVGVTSTRPATEWFRGRRWRKSFDAVDALLEAGTFLDAIFAFDPKTNVHTLSLMVASRPGRTGNSFVEVILYAGIKDPTIPRDTGGVADAAFELLCSCARLLPLTMGYLTWTPDKNFAFENQVRDRRPARHEEQILGYHTFTVIPPTFVAGLGGPDEMARSAPVERIGAIDGPDGRPRAVTRLRRLPSELDEDSLGRWKSYLGERAVLPDPTVVVGNHISLPRPLDVLPQDWPKLGEPNGHTTDPPT